MNVLTFSIEIIGGHNSKGKNGTFHVQKHCFWSLKTLQLSDDSIKNQILNKSVPVYIVKWTTYIHYSFKSF